jgi:hypothetical protein
MFCHDHPYVEASDLVDVTSALGYAPAKLVVPGDPGASVLYQKVANTGLYGPAMPQGTTGLPANQREKFRLWILEGAHDN